MKQLPFLLLSILILYVLISLGNWQVRRLAEKETYLDSINAKLQAAPAPLPKQPDPEQDQFLVVETDGTFDGAFLRFLVSTRDFGAGFRIVQRFETDGRHIMVDRGFLPTARKNMKPPTGPASIIGTLHWPDERDSATPENDPISNIWYAREVSLMAEALGTEPLLVIARESADGLAALPVDTSSIPNRHMEYIFTWYGLALTWVLMTLYFLFRRKRTRSK